MRPMMRDRTGILDRGGPHGLGQVLSSARRSELPESVCRQRRFGEADRTGKSAFSCAEGCNSREGYTGCPRVCFAQEKKRPRFRDCFHRLPR